MCTPCAWWQKFKMRQKYEKLELAMNLYNNNIVNIKKHLKDESDKANEQFRLTIFHQKNQTGSELIYAVSYIQHMREIQKLNKELMKESSKLHTVKRSSRMDKSREADSVAAQYVDFVFEDDEKAEDDQDKLREADDRHTEMIEGLSTQLSDDEAARKLLTSLEKQSGSRITMPSITSTFSLLSLSSTDAQHVPQVQQVQHAPLSLLTSSGIHENKSMVISEPSSTSSISTDATKTVAKKSSKHIPKSRLQSSSLSN